MNKNQLTVYGKVDLQIDSLELKATLVFTPYPDGEPWDADGIIKLIKSRSIEDPITKVELDKKIKSWQSVKTETSAIIAEGAPPEKTLHERIEWLPMEIPENLKSKITEIYENAPPLKVFSRVKEKVKIEKIVKQKSILPFIPGKEEKVSEWEMKETLIEGNVDEQVLYKGLVSKDQLLGKLVPGKIGKNGVSIFNKPIPPENVKRITFYTGNGVVLQKNEIRATQGGFLRAGNDWADIIPYKTHFVNIYLSDDKKKMLLDFEPGAKNSDFPDVQDILKKMQEAGFSEDEMISGERIIEIIRKSIETNTPVLKKILNKSRNSEIKIIISPDKSKVTMDLIKESGTGKPLTLEDIGKEINKLKIPGINKEILKSDILKFYKGNKKEFLDYTLASGTPPERGKDGTIEFKCTFIPQEEKTKLIKELKSVSGVTIESEKFFPKDNIEEIAYVKKDEIIACLISPGPGKPGKDVFGQEIPGTRGNDPDISILENVLLSKSNLVAAQSGILEKGKKENTILLRLRELENAQVLVKLNDKKTKALVTFFPHKGTGKPITLDQINSELTKNKIIKGINSSLLMNLVAKVQMGQTIEDAVIAEGLMPVTGSGYRLVFHYDIAAGTPQEIANARKPKNQSSAIEQGAIIAEIMLPAIQPKDGWDVTGEKITADPGLSINIQAGQNVKKITKADGVVQFIADKNGELFYDGKLIEIKDQLIIKSDVGPKTGNINSPGSLKINGSVLAGYNVFSKGNIEIAGSVTGAVLSSDGTIEIMQDVTGISKTAIRAKKEIILSNCEDAILLAVADIKIKEKCTNCTIKCNGKIIQNSNTGFLAGGIIKAKKGIELYNLGTEKGIITQVSFGQDYLIGDQVEIEEKELQKLNKQIELYDNQMKKLELESEKNKETLFKIRKSKRMTLKIIEKRTYRLFTLREKFEEHIPSEIIIKGKLYPGVTIESHGRFFEVKVKKEKVIIIFNTVNGKFDEKPLS